MKKKKYCSKTKAVEKFEKGGKVKKYSCGGKMKARKKS